MTPTPETARQDTPAGPLRCLSCLTRHPDAATTIPALSPSFAPIPGAIVCRDPHACYAAARALPLDVLATLTRP